VAWVPAANIHLVTGFDEIMEIERNPEIFASTNPMSLMNKIMGHTLMRKDGTEHKLERKALEPTFRPGTVKRHWSPIFERICDQLIAELHSKNGAAELFTDLAAPMASLSLIELMGFKDVRWQDVAKWSQALMDAVGNYGSDPEIEARGMAASSAIDEAINHVIDDLRANPNPSAISSMLHCEDALSIAQIQANIKVAVGGGLNEPRDAILSAAFALLSNPEQRRAVREDPSLFMAVFEEAVRWISPIGMYPRRVTQDTTLGGVELKAETQIGVCVGAANRDPVRFKDAAEFNIFREKASHLGFGAGPHFCAGTWVARMMVGQVVVPRLFDSFPTLRLAKGDSVDVRGWVFRGPVKLAVEW